jgi:Gram-negative bacterial TonB protein C-terminal
MVASTHRSDLIALVGLALLAGAAATVSVAEASPRWTVSGRNGTCSMLRPYDKSDPTWVVIARNVDDEQFIRVHDDRWKVTKGEEYSATLTFDGSATVVPARGAITDGSNRISGFISTTNIDWQSTLTTALRMTIRIPGNVEAVVDLTGASVALTAMIRCVENARAVGAVALRSPPQATATFRMSAKDYADLEAGDVAGKVVTVRLLIDTLGRPKRCHVVGSSSKMAVDDRTCALAIDRMRFLPAIASDGRSVEASYQFRIVL